MKRRNKRHQLTSRSGGVNSVDRGEHLENRTLLTVVWGNRGTTDNFVGAYGADAALARTIVDHAINDWNEAFPTATLTVNITAGNFNAAGVRGATTNVTMDALQRPATADIFLDNDAAGMGWFMDPSIISDLEFPVLNSPFNGSPAANSGLTGYDFFTTVSHELGHAHGYFRGIGLAIDNFLTPNGPGQFTFNNPNVPNGITATMLEGSHSADPLDLMAPGGAVLHRRLISTEVARVLSDAYGYHLYNGLPIQRDTLHVDTALVAGNVVATVQQSTAFSDFSVTTGTATQSVNFSTAAGIVHERLPTNTTQVIINGSSNDDSLQVYRSGTLTPVSVVFNGNGGTDQGFFMMPNLAGVARDVTLSGNSAFGPAVGTTHVFNVEIGRVAGSEFDDTVRVKNNNFQFVWIDGLGGNDTIDGWDNGATTTGVLYAWGGEGNDTIWGTPNADIIVGGNGNDTLWGGNGRDILVGGLGLDSVSGNDASAHEDLIVSGSVTLYENHWTALRAVRDEWISAKTRAQRITNITSNPNGTGLNGPYLLNSSIVLDDSVVDSVFQQNNIDWWILS